MYTLWIKVGQFWSVVNSYKKLQSAVFYGNDLHQKGEQIKIEDKDGNDYTDMVFE